MAKKILIDLEVKKTDAEVSLADVVKELKKLNKQALKTTGELDEGLKDVKKSADGAGKGFFKFSNILKGGLIITALNKAFEFFKETLGQNQVVVDFFAVTFESLSIAFNDFFDLIFNNVGGVVDSFKSIFEDPKQSLIDFADAFKRNIQERFESYLDTLGFLASAVKKVFSGDFKGALEDVKNAGKESLDVFTGINNSFDKTAEATSNYVKETIKAGKANVELEKQAAIAAVRNQGLIEQFDIQAEKQRQIRDEERNSIEERIEANNKLREVLEEQGKTMTENAQAVLDAAQAQFDKNDNDANAIALQEAKNELLAVEATVTGFLSEQKVNDLALDRELLELTNSKLESEANLGIERKRINASKIEDDLIRLEREKEIDLEEATIQRNRLQRIVDEANEGTQAKVDAQIALDEFEVEMTQKKLDRGKEIIEAEKLQKQQEDLILDAKLKAQIGFAQAVGNVVGALGGLLQEGTNASKAAALADIIIKTGVGFAQGLDIAQKTAAGATGPAAAFTFPIFYAQQIASVLSTVNQAKQILSKVKGGGVSTGGDISGGRGVSTPSAPAFNIVGSDPQTQLAEAIGQQTQKPVKAFVVAGDVSTAQSLDRNIIQESSLG